MLVAIALAVLSQTEVPAERPPDMPTTSSVRLQERVGAVVAPGSLPAGSSAAYGFIGAPEIGAGYRQGVTQLELEGRLLFDYLTVAAAAEGIVKLTVLRSTTADLTTSLGFGLVWNSGARYFDNDNFDYLAVRPKGGLLITLSVAETVRALLLVDASWDITFAPPQGSRVKVLGGGGAEVFLGRDLYGLAVLKFGLDAVKEDGGGVLKSRLGWQAQLGLGYRLF